MKKGFFRTKWATGVVLLFLMVATPGCIYFVVGGIGAVGGYIVSPDTVEGITSHDSSSIWDAAKDVVSIMGTVVEEQEDGGFLVAKINGARVTISIVGLNNSTSKVSVKARKFRLPRISLAQDVFVKIMGYVNE